MAKAYLSLDTRRAKKDQTYPIKIIIIHNGQPIRLPTGYSVLQKDWNEPKSYIKTSCKQFSNVTRVNKILEKQKKKVLDVITALADENILDELSNMELKNKIVNKQSELNILAFCRVCIDRLKSRNKIGNARVYRTLHNSIATFLGNESVNEPIKDMPIARIKVQWLENYEQWYLQRGNSVNGLSVNMRTLRALYNKAIQEQSSLQEKYPFGKKGYIINNEKTQKRAISQQELLKILEFIPQTSRQEKAKDYFLISFYMMGASFIDMAYLKSSDIRHGRINYKRRKTNKTYTIKIISPLQKLLDKYGQQSFYKDYILPVIKSAEPAEQYTNVKDELQRYNRTMKEIGKLCGIDATITSYVSRHSYATISKYLGVPTAVISEALGHDSEKTTQVYLDSFETELMDSFHEKVTEIFSN